MLRRFPDPNVEAECLLSRATLENELGSLEKSAPAIHRAIAIRDSLGQTRDMFYVSLLTELATRSIARTDSARPSPQAARDRAARFDRSRPDDVQRCHSTQPRRSTTIASARWRRAESTLADVMRRMSESDPDGRMPQQSLIHYAHAALYQSDPDSARKYFAHPRRSGHRRSQHRIGKAARCSVSHRPSCCSDERPSTRQTIEGFRAVSGNPDLVHSDDQVMKVNTLDALVALAAGDTVRGNALVAADARATTATSRAGGAACCIRR